jgi:Acyltransferase family
MTRQPAYEGDVALLGQTASASVRFEALDALRGVCALLVVLFHIPIYHGLKDDADFANLQFCVDMFFALSGFVLCHAYGQRLNDGVAGVRFTVMRLARRWPLHVVMLALFVSLEVAKLVFSRADTSFALDSQAFAPGHSLSEIVTNVLFLQSFGLHSGLTWNGVAWSAALEFYVSAEFGAAETRLMVLLDLHDPYLHIPGDEDGCLFHRPKGQIRSGRLAQRRQADLAGNAGAGAVAGARPLRRPRRACRRPHLSLDREARNGCGPARLVDGTRGYAWRDQLGTVAARRFGAARRPPSALALKIAGLFGTDFDRARPWRRTRYRQAQH